MSREEHSNYADDNDCPARSTELDENREFTTMSLTASPSSSCYKMSIDSDDAHSVSSVSLGRQATTSYAYTSTATLQLSPGAHAESSTQRRTANRPPSDFSPGLFNWGYPESAFRNREEAMSDSESSQHSNSAVGRIWKHPTRTSRRNKKSPSNDIRHTSADTRQDPVRRNVSRRASLLPKSKALARVLVQADEDIHPADTEMRREKETTAQIRQSFKPSMDADNSPFKPQPGQSVPAAAWARLREMECSPIMIPYQCSRLNAEIDMPNFQLDGPLSPMHATFRAVKRKGSEDRLYEPYPANSLKRRAVSPSLSLSGSPILSGISSPPASYAHYNAPSPGGSSGNTSKGHSKPGHLPTKSYNLQDASGGISRMTLNE